MNKFHAYSIGVAFLLMTLVIPLPSLAQGKGRCTIAGMVKSAETSEPVIGATVYILNTTRGGFTDADGAFAIDRLPAGTYNVKVSSLGYEDVVVEGLRVDDGQTINQNFSMTPEALETEGVTITGKRSKKSKEGLLTARRNALQVTDAISSEEISSAGASDAGDAMKRVTGVSVVGDKYVVVRGLSERYNGTQLNGVNLPSPEPEKKVVPFDLFPAGMIDNMTTVKTFTPDNPGDFAGGLVKIETKDFPEHFIFNLGVGSGFNTETQGADALGYEGGGTDFLGVDDGTRSLPEGVETGKRFSSQEQAALLSQFNNDVLRPQNESLPPNGSINLTVGNSFGSEDKPIGVLFSTSYSSGYKYRQGVERSPLLELDNEGAHVMRFDYNTREAEQSVLWGGLLNLSFGLGEGDVIGVKGVLNHSSEDQSILVTGDFNSSTTGQVRRTQLRFVERTIGGIQLLGEHRTDLLSDNSRIEWRAAISLADRSEPDNRSTAYLRDNENDQYRYNGNFGSGNGRFFSELDDIETSLGFDWTLPLYFGDDIDTDYRLKVGGTARMRQRDFSARRFFFSPGLGDPDVLALDPETLFTPEYVEQGFVRFDDNTLPNDQYSADERVVAGYAMIELPVSERLRFIGGARLEWWDLDLVPFNQISQVTLQDLAVTQSVVDVLPSVNVIYGLNDRMNLRGSFSQTLARPEFRELAPFRFDDYRQSTFGNPSLERTRILNFDARWEWFPRAGELFAVSGFYKNFTNPIEQFYLLGTSDIQVEPVNANGANTYGVELELRKGLDQLADFLSDFSLGTNVTLVESTISFDEGQPVNIFDGVSVVPASTQVLTNLDRPLQGQSPYVINVMLGYGNRSTGTDATLLYNIFGERLAAVGTNNYPDIYEQPRPTLDLTIKQALPAGLSLKVGAKNLLDSETRFTQEFTGQNAELVETERYFSGRSFSFGLSFNYDQFRLQKAGL